MVVQHIRLANQGGQVTNKPKRKSIRRPLGVSPWDRHVVDYCDDPLGPATWDVDDDAPLPDDDDAAGCPDPATLPDVCGLCNGDGVVRVPDESTVFPVVATCACVWDESDDVFPFDR
jgi:hypothetical protein